VGSTISLNTIDGKDVAKRIKAIESKMEIEEKLLKGAEALVKVSTGAQRQDAERQLEASLSLISGLKAELEKLRQVEAEVEDVSLA
jgi:capsule polysaccharide export protein KpsE/RkpR